MELVTSAVAAEPAIREAPTAYLPPTRRRILRPKAQAKKLGVHLSTIYRIAASDASFPKSFKVGRNSAGRFDDEIDAWLLSRQAAA